MQTDPSSSMPDTPADALEILRQDHERVVRLFAEFDALQEAGATERQRIAQIVQQVSAALMLHAQLEEEVFYPAAEQALGEARLVEQARQEHAQAKETIRRLTTLQPDDAQLAPSVAELAREVAEHVRMEEQELFEQLRGRLDTLAVGAQLAQRRRQLEATSEKPEEDYPVENDV